MGSENLANSSSLDHRERFCIPKILAHPKHLRYGIPITINSIVLGVDLVAIEIHSPGPDSTLHIAERRKPIAREGEVIISVQAAGVANADLLQRRGIYPPPSGASDIPGLDVAGTIDSIGQGVSGWKVGDQVCAIVPGGGYAEFCVAPALQVLPKPEGWSFIEAACLCENIFTVYDSLITRAKLKHGETALIHGGTSGIGSMAVMLSRAVGAIPIATAGTAAKCDACLGFGAESAINYEEMDFVSEVKRATDERGVDVVLDLVGGPYVTRNLDCLALEGRISIIAPHGCEPAQLKIESLMEKRASIFGSTMRKRTPEEKGRIAEALLADIWPLLPSKQTIRPIIDSTFVLSDAQLAHDRMGNRHIGKIVLTVCT